MAFLVVEDDEAAQRVFARTLRPLGEAHFAGTLAAARIALRERAWTAIFVDVGLPDGSGLDLLRDAHALEHPPPALVVTGRRKGIANAAFDLGAEHVEKPVTAKRIFGFAARALSDAEGRRRRLKRAVDSLIEQHGLTATEGEILLDAARGTSQQDIAELRAIQSSTMKTHVHNLLGKVGREPSLEALVGRILRDAARQT